VVRNYVVNMGHVTEETGIRSWAVSEDNLLMFHGRTTLYLWTL